MKTLHTKYLKDGRRHVLIELAPNEPVPIAPIRTDSFYKLGYPMDDTVVESHIIYEPQRVAWDSFSQKWVEA